MLKQNKITKEWLDVNVTAEGEVIKESFEVDKNVEHIIGVLMTSDRDDLLMLRGSVKILINDEEHFPEGYESKLIMCGQNVQPNVRMYKFDPPVEPGNRKVELQFTDNPNSMVVFAAYRVRLTVYGKLKE